MTTAGRRPPTLLFGVAVGVLLLAACGDDDGGANSAASAADGCDLVGIDDVEAAFGGSADSAEVPDDSPPGTCIFDLEGIDAGGDGQVAVVPLEESDDEEAAFELNCQVEEAEDLTAVADRACYADEFQELYVLVGDRQLFLRAPIGHFFDDADPAELRESFLELGRTTAAAV